MGSGGEIDESHPLRERKAMIRMIPVFFSELGGVDWITQELERPSPGETVIRTWPPIAGGGDGRDPDYGLAGSGFFAQTWHHPAAVTSLPPKAPHGPDASPAFPV